MKARTAQVNQIRGLLGEFDIVIPQGIRHVFKQLPFILDEIEETLPASFSRLLRRLGKNLQELD